MNIHEYQAKELLRSFEVAVPRGGLATNPLEAAEIARNLGGALWVVKAQIHAGGRGKGGGICLARNSEEVKEHATALLGQSLVTPQTGPQGQIVNKVYIEEGIDIERQLYFALLIDRASRQIMAITSAEGGVEIEVVARDNPNAIIKIPIDSLVGVQPFHARKFAYSLGLEGPIKEEAMRFFVQMTKAFVALDASLMEINPLVITKQGHFVALDAKFNFDDNALFRHPEILALRDTSEEDPSEIEAAHYDLSYVKLDGNIGCMVNGAGLAMATMDMITLKGGMPANFLDVGGSADQERVTKAFELILADSAVQVVLVNIFGGIMHCDTIAQGIVAAARDTGMTIPLVVRLEGTNFEEGKEILVESGLSVIIAEGLEDAAAAAVRAANGRL